MKPAVLAGLATGLAIPGYGVYRRYRRDMNAVQIVRDELAKFFAEMPNRGAARVAS